MYDEIERKNTLNYLVDKFKKIDEIISVIQVGSGVFGYKDKYSDLDFAVVVDNINIKDIFDKIYKIVDDKYNIIFFDNMEERKLQLFLLDNYLEIDIGYYKLDDLTIKKREYKVIFDKSNRIEKIIEKSLSEYNYSDENMIKESNMEEIITFIDNELWYNVLHSIIAFKRNDIYRCYYELEQIKWYVIDLITKRNNVESRRYRSLNELDKEELNKIDYLFIYPNDYNELSLYLKKSLNTIFNEFSYWKEKYDINIIGSLEYYINYIDINK